MLQGVICNVHLCWLIFSSQGPVAGVWWVKSALASWSWTDRLARCVWDLGRIIYSIWPSFTSFIGPIKKMSVCQKGVLQRKWKLWTSDGVAWFLMQFLCSLRGTWALNVRFKTGREGVRDIGRSCQKRTLAIWSGTVWEDQMTPVRCCLSFHWNICF